MHYGIAAGSQHLQLLQALCTAVVLALTAMTNKLLHGISPPVKALTARVHHVASVPTQ